MGLTRSEIMGRVRQKRTSPEQAVARFLQARGLRFRYNVRGLPGTPDLANKRRRFAIFVHGCFWHRHKRCRKASTPSTNRAFWLAKFSANLRRDRLRAAQLRRLGYQVIIVWECEAGSPVCLRRALKQLRAPKKS